MKEKRNKLIAIMALSMFLLSYMALTPIVANIYNSFPTSSLEEVQMIVTLIPLFSVVTMFACDLLSKKMSMKMVGIIGLVLISFGGALTYVFHRAIWQIYLSSILLGLGIGLINVISSAMIAYYFDGAEKMKVMGYQSIFVSIGGALFSYFSGLLANINWPYSYLCFLMALVVIVLDIYLLPKHSVKANEEDEQMIKEMQRNTAFMDPTRAAAHLVGAQAGAMQAAAANPNAGPAMAFMGMGMAGQAGGMNPQNLYQMGQQPPVNPSVATVASGWTCSCGATATGKFCPECGKSRPVPIGWTCSCGTVNKGKFCVECGTPKPAGMPQYKCDKCGWEPDDPKCPPKFCPECGDPFDDGDIRG